MHYGATNSNTKHSSHDKDYTRIQPSQGAQEATLLQEQRNNNACTAVMEPKSEEAEDRHGRKEKRMNRVCV